MQSLSIARWHAFALALLTGLALVVATPAHALFGSSGQQQDFLPVHEAFPFNAIVDGDDLLFQWQVTPEHYLYQDQIRVEVQSEEGQVSELQFSMDSVVREDPYFGKVPVFLEDVSARVQAELPQGQDELRLNVTWQGCAEAGLCYPPETERLLYNAASNTLTHVEDERQSRSRRDSPQPAQQPADNQVEQRFSFGGLQGILEQRTLLTIAAVFYLLGLGLTFTPCVLPMIPIVSAVVAGQRQLTTLQAFWLSLSYVLGMALTYAAAGVLVGLLGAGFNVQAWLQSPAVLSIFAGLFVLLALAMFGAYEIRLPQTLQDRLNQQSQQLSGGRVASVFGIGSLSALIVSPCVTAPLAAALVFISATQDAVVGGTALLWLGLGMGTPLLLVGTGGQRFMPRPGPWMDGIKALFGFLMLAIAVWLLERVLPGPVGVILWGVLAAMAGVQLGAFESVRDGWSRTRKGLGLLLFAAGLLVMAGGLAGANDPTRPLAPFTAGGGADAHEQAFEQFDDPAALDARMEQAAADGQPVMVDLYADWCISCKIMERRVFSDGDIAEQMGDYTRLQLDVTDNSRAQQDWLNRYGLFGPPTLLFFDADGEELEQARVMGEMSRRQFSQHMEQVNRLRRG